MCFWKKAAWLHWVLLGQGSVGEHSGMHMLASGFLLQSCELCRFLPGHRVWDCGIVKKQRIQNTPARGLYAQEMTPLTYTFQLVGSAGTGAKVSLRVLKAEAPSYAGCSVDGDYCVLCCVLTGQSPVPPRLSRHLCRARPSLVVCVGPLG